MHVFLCLGPFQHRKLDLVLFWIYAIKPSNVKEQFEILILILNTTFSMKNIHKIEFYLNKN